MTVTPGAMTDSELKREIDHHQALIAELSPTAPARATLEQTLASFLNECADRRRLRTAHGRRATSQYTDADA